MTPGGSMANIYSILVSRQLRFPDTKKKGLAGMANLRFYISELGHYSIEKGLIMTGHGQDSLVKIKTDSKGKIIPEELVKQIEQDLENGLDPFYICGLLGTTVFGANDPIKELIDIKNKYNLYFHIDGCYGGHQLIDTEFKNEIPNINEVDSISWDMHKQFPITQQGSFFLTRHNGLLLQGLSINAQYLFMSDKIQYDSKRYDTGDKSVQCGRKNDIFKCWVYWQSNGTELLQQKIRQCKQDTWNFAQTIKEKGQNFQLLIDPEWTSVCFYYFPDRFLDKSEFASEDQFTEEFNKIAPLIKNKMTGGEGKFMIAYMKQNSHGYGQTYNFFRPIFYIRENNVQWGLELLEEIHRIGQFL